MANYRHTIARNYVREDSDTVIIINNSPHFPYRVVVDGYGYGLQVVRVSCWSENITLYGMGHWSQSGDHVLPARICRTLDSIANSFDSVDELCAFVSTLE